MLNELLTPMMPDEAIGNFRDGSRFWIQRVAVPVITVIGMFGNTITIIIMTRRGMRSTTNLYLAALALCDMLYLVLTFLLSLEHYPNMAAPEYYLYWKLKPYLMMSTDACSNTSVWLTVTFTIERYIAVKYPMKGKVWCTESRAKLLILSVFIFGISFATPVPFEWLVVKKNVINNGSGSEFVWTLDYSDFGKNDTYKTIYYRSTAAIFYIIPMILLIYFNGCLIHSVHQSSRERSEMTGGTMRKSKAERTKSVSTSTPKVVVDVSMTGENGKINNNLKLLVDGESGSQEFCQQEQYQSNLTFNDKKSVQNSTEAEICSKEQTTSQVEHDQSKEVLTNSDVTSGESTDLNVQIRCDSELSNRKSNDISSPTTKESDGLIEKEICGDVSKLNMEGNNNSTRCSPARRFIRNITIANSHAHHSGMPHASQERRITIMLISVVILFLCCQLPSAMMILYTATRELRPNTNEHALVLAFGNIFNYLMAINAAGNFILYSLLSKKYRRTFVKLFCNCFKNKNPRDTNQKTFSVRFEAVGNSLRSKTSKCQINKSANNKQDTLV